MLALLPPSAAPSLRAALTAAGLSIRVAGASLLADVVLPAKGGSIAFVLLRTPQVTAEAAARVAAAANSSRRCTVLWIYQETSELQHLGTAAAWALPDATVLWCASLQQAVEHILSCAKEVNRPVLRAALKVEDAANVHQAQVAQYLGARWGAETHEVEFMLATRPLHSLACVTSEASWARLLHETSGLVHTDLLYAAIQWLQNGGEELELGV
ncbi:hypothetical protein AB1Y20_015111 [Prymnesium parvum]|uniref:Uncharacterized protein n=1 Tax=Prymnesium parvum TaxID=97485 RepID=A0AB34JW42_PRYPA